MLRESLAEQSMAVEIAGDGRAMDEHMRASSFDLIVLDIMLPGEDGLSICRRLRAKGNLPILMLTSLGDDIDRILGLELGADDYVTKPFVLRELVARIKGLLRRAAYEAGPEPPRSRFIRFEGWTIDMIKRQVHDAAGARVAMTTHELDLLVAFCRNAGRTLTREQLLAATHAGLAGPTERSVDVHIRRLRQKMESDPRNPVLIRTVRLGGYMFTARVEESHD
ncbi:DNA-binding response regulator [Pleomorphomonas diazotrophica]|uniref:Regulatory protein VirG n=2 Tax=Pleomorphomonas diazotrophica TaxID=1166257 RepID=A0A2N3LZ16_9HYPH|nr:DNA-binding response regulator [Pleomorphomonas diazotrophica]